MLADLFGGGKVPEKAVKAGIEPVKPEIVPETKPDTAKTSDLEGTAGLMAEIKASETPVIKEIKFKSKKGTEVNVKYSASAGVVVEPALKELVEAIENGTLEAEKQEAEKEGK